MPRDYYDGDGYAAMRGLTRRELAEATQRLDELSEEYALDDSSDSGDEDAATLDDADDEGDSLDDLSANSHEPLTIAHSHGDYTTHFHDDDADHRDAPPALVNDVDSAYAPREYEAAFEGMAGVHGTYVPGAGGPPEPWANRTADARQALTLAPATGAEVHELSEAMARRRGKRLSDLSPAAQLRLLDRVARATGYGRGAELAGEDAQDAELSEANSLAAEARRAARQQGVRLSELSPADRLRFYERIARRSGYGGGHDDGGDAA